MFAGGDVAFGPRIIITAVAEGKRAAQLRSRNSSPGRAPAAPRQARVTIYDTQRYRMKPDYEKFERRSPPTLPLDRRIGIAEVEKIYPEADARRQADRCLKCHVGPGLQRRRVHPVRRLRGCLPGVLPAAGGCRRPARRRKRCRPRFWPAMAGCPAAGEQGAIIKDETRCIRCGLCAVRCPTGAITMERVELVPA